MIKLAFLFAIDNAQRESVKFRCPERLRICLLYTRRNQHALSVADNKKSAADLHKPEKQNVMMRVLGASVFGLHASHFLLAAATIDLYLIKTAFDSRK